MAELWMTGFIFVDRAGDRAVGDQGDQGQAAEVREVAGALECMTECNWTVLFL